MSRKNAYVFFLLKGDAYTASAIVCAHALRKFKKPTEDLVVAISPLVTPTQRAFLEESRVFDRIVDIPLREIQTKPKLESWADPAYYDPFLSQMPTELGVLALEEYAKILVMHVDMVCVRDISSLFDLAAPAGLFSIRKYGAADHGRLIPEVDRGNQRTCSSLLLLEPCTQTLNELDRLIADYPDEVHLCGPEEEILTRYYRNKWHYIRRDFAVHSYKFVRDGGYFECTSETARIMTWSAGTADGQPCRSLTAYPDFEQWDASAKQILREKACLEPLFRAIPPATRLFGLVPAKSMSYSVDWTTPHTGLWSLHLKRFVGVPRVRMVEIGCFEGRSSRWFCENILTGKDSVLYCVDPLTTTLRGHTLHDGSPSLFDQFQANVSDLLSAGKLQCLRGTSRRVLVETRDFVTNPIDIVYIDGSHQAPDVLFDAVMSFRLLKEGGVIVFDDYNMGSHKVAQSTPKLAIDAFLACHEHQITIDHIDWQVIVTKRMQSVPTVSTDRADRPKRTQIKGTRPYEPTSDQEKMDRRSARFGM